MLNGSAQDATANSRRSHHFTFAAGLIIVYLLSTTLVAWSTTTVVITSPSSGLTTPQQVGVVAYAYGNDSIWVMQIYLDHVGKVYEQVQPPHNRINTLINVQAGARLLTVQAVDSHGNVLGLAQLNFNATSSPIILGATPPQLDDQTSSWQACDPAKGCHSSNNNTATPPLIAGGSANPNEDGSAAEFQTQNFNNPPAPSYDTAFWWLPQTAPQGSVDHYFKYDFDLFIETAYVGTPQALEWEMQQTVNGYVYNMGWQADYNGAGAGGACVAAPQNVWRVFNYASQCWEQVNLSLTRFLGNTWYHISQENHIDSHGTVWHDALTVTDKSTQQSTRLDPSVFNSSLGAWQSISHVPPFFASRPNEFHNAVQLDINSSGSVYRIFVDNMTVTYVP